MASLYTDEAREERYFKLRAKKKRLERILDWMMWIVLAAAALTIIPDFASAFLNGVFLGDLHALFELLVDVAVYGFAIYAIYRKSAKLTGIAVAVVLLGAVLTGSPLSLVGMIPLLLLLYVDVQWGKLEKEEGFPHFDITYAEREERQRTAEERARNRAIQAGARVAATEQSSDMGDLLDAGHDTMVIAPTLRGYHDRSRDSSRAAETPRQFAPGVMDTLEAIGSDAVRQESPHVPQQDPNVPEIQVSPESLPTLELMDAPAAAPQPAAPQPVPDQETALGAIGAEPEYDSSADDEINGLLAAMNSGIPPQS